MTFSVAQKTKILSLKSAIASYYNLQMKKIGDSQLASLLYDNCIITGGCIASLYHNEAVNDIDVYATDTRSMMRIKTHIIDDGNNIKLSNTYNLDIAEQYKPLVTDNAVTLTNDIQFIYLGTADDCRPKFDFVHCMPWFDIRTQKLYISEAQYASIESKTLVPNISGEFIKQRRVEKYAKRGWNTKNIVHKFPDVV